MLSEKKQKVSIFHFALYTHAERLLLISLSVVLEYATASSMVSNAAT